MTNKQKYNVIVQKIEKLEIEKEKIYNIILEETTDRKELFHIIIDSDVHSGYIIDITRDGILDKLLDGDYVRKYEIVNLSTSADDLIESYILPTYSEQLEMYKFLNYNDDFSEDDYEEMKNDKYIKKIEFKDFVDFVDDVIKAKVGSFDFDW